MKKAVGVRLRRSCISLFGVGLILLADSLGFFEGINLSLYDLAFRLRGPRTPDSRIAIVAVDEKSLGRLGTWPISRGNYARLIDAASKAEAVAFNVIMAEPSSGDRDLAEAMARHTRVVLSVYIDSQRHVIVPASPLTPARIGHLHVEQGLDGIARAVFHRISIGEMTLSSLAEATVSFVPGAKLLPPERGRPERLVPDLIFQREPSLLNYYGPPGTFRSISLADIIDGTVPPGELEGKILLVGPTAKGIDGSMLTPFSELRAPTPGVEVQATIASNLLDGTGIRAIVPWVRQLSALALVLPMFLLFPRLRSGPAGLLWLGSLLAVTAAAYGFFAARYLWVGPSVWYFSLSFAYFATYIFRIEEMSGLVLRAKEEWEETFNAIEDAIFICDDRCSVIRQNKAAERLFRESPEFWEDCLETCRGESGTSFTNEVTLPSSGRHFEVRSFRRLEGDDSSRGFVCIVKDITERMSFEEEQARLRSQLLQAQKLESVGRLAGGVAHDFNNMLTAILGFSEMALIEVRGNETLRRYIEMIHESGKKVRSLTQQLLAFSRKLVMECKAVNLSAIVDNMAKMAQRIIGEDVKLIVRTNTPTRNVLADAGQIEQVLMNLLVNARDAMPEGGVVTVETAEVDLDPGCAEICEGLRPGAHVMLSVSDTGVGMTKEVQDRIFEPFFTTKEMGKGTGLGLATVYGIIKQLNGRIVASSEQGKGATFTIYLPATDQPAGVSKAVESPGPRRGTETVLVAEDDASIRSLIACTLQPLGYTVLDAANGEEALRVSDQFTGTIHLLLADVVMPGMNGKELADRLRDRRPSLKVVFMSGYADDAIAGRGVLEPGVVLVQKPLTPGMVATRIRDVLDGTV